MDGYSIKEAASVLGIPKRRVWELIARGVLSGAPEGDGGMRVFLQPRATPPSAERRAADEPRTKGNGGHPEPSFEASPFREVLTEFRMLTERYGQALLALGEARGEVAALRSRVEQLEARIDLRLPGPRPASTVAWEMPDHPPAREPRPEPSSEPGPAETDEVAAAPPTSKAEVETDAGAPAPALAGEVQPEAEPEPWAEIPVTEPVAPEPPGVEGSLDDVLQVEGAPDVAPATEPEPTEVDALAPGESVASEETAAPADTASPSEPIEPPVRKRRARSSRPAMAAFSAALERAQDPTLADLPGAREAGEAMAAFQRQVEDLGLRDELAVDEAPPEAALVEDTAALGDDVATEEAHPGEVLPGAEPIEAIALEPPVEHIAPDEPIFEPVDVTPVPLEALVAEPAEAPIEAIAHEPPVEQVAPDQPIFEPVDVAPVPFEPKLAPEPTLEPAFDAEPAVEAELSASALDAVEPVEETEPGAASELATATAASPYTTEVVEPDWFADGDFTWLEAATAATEEESAEEVGEEEMATADAPAAEVPPATEPADAPPAVVVGGVEQEAAEAVAEETAFEPLEASVQPVIRSQPEAAPVTPQRAPPKRQDEEELMWLGDEFDAAELELETPGWGSHPAAPAPPERMEPPLLELSDAELAQLASDEGWDPTEVEAIRTFLGRSMGAADASRGQPSETAATTGVPDDVHPLDEAAPGDVAESAPAVAPPVPDGPPDLPDAAAIGEEGVHGITGEPHPGPAGQTERDWLRGRRGPAATAYRRLRRLFPG